MNKEQFLSAVHARLDYLPREATEKFIDFYIEAIDDRIEDGMSEEEAVAAVGDVESVVHAIESELPLGTIVKQRVKSSRERAERSDSGHSAWWIALAVLSSPVWLSLVIALSCVLIAAVISVYVAVWAVVVSLFAVLLALGLGAVFLLVYALTRLFAAGLAAALLCLGFALAMAGAGAALLWPCVLLSKCLVKLPVRFWHWIKGLFIGRRRNDW